MCTCKDISRTHVLAGVVRRNALFRIQPDIFAVGHCVLIRNGALCVCVLLHTIIYNEVLEYYKLVKEVPGNTVYLCSRVICVEPLHDNETARVAARE